eukprot:scaffold112623_cov105-Phaeocystis_antarctica.AAC.1
MPSCSGRASGAAGEPVTLTVLNGRRPTRAPASKTASSGATQLWSGAAAAQRLVLKTVPHGDVLALHLFKRGRGAAHELVRGECTQPDGGQRWAARMGLAASLPLPGLQTIVVLQRAIDVQGVGDAAHEKPVARLTAYRGQLSQAVHDTAPFEVAQRAAASTPRHPHKYPRHIHWQKTTSPTPNPGSFLAVQTSRALAQTQRPDTPSSSCRIGTRRARSLGQQVREVGLEFRTSALPRFSSRSRRDSSAPRCFVRERPWRTLIKLAFYVDVALTSICRYANFFASLQTRCRNSRCRAARVCRRWWRREVTAEAVVSEEREGAMAAAATVAEVTVEAKGAVARVEARVAVAILRLSYIRGSC